MIIELDIGMPRHAFTTRDVARAGDVWRCMQEVAVQGSAACGWHPSRYRQVGSAFIVRSMRVVHHRESAYGEELNARTWVADFRRGILTRREIRLDSASGLVASGSQEWVHVNDQMRPTRAPAEMLAAFGPQEHEPTIELPEWEPDVGAEHAFAFVPWHTWMDPLGHANHPAYVDYCDEATSRAMAAAGLDPTALQAVAEEVTWKAGVEAGDAVQVLSRVVGRAGNHTVVQEHRILRGDDLAATATTLRRLAHGDPDALRRALG